MLPHSPAQVFDLVADVESYPEFLPWCSSARVRKRDGNLLLADLTIGYRVFSESFASRVILHRPSAIEVHYERGPFRHLRNSWRFASIGPAACEVRFEIDFAFRSFVLERAVGGVFNRAFGRMVESFEQRAARLYASSSNAAA